jgi:hypothetical protein
MGSKTSIVERNNSLLSFEEDLLDYNGIKTSEENLEENELNYEDIDSYSNNNIKNNNNKIDVNKIPITFEWESGGNSVYLTGNFCNWEQFFLMEKKPNGKHTVTLHLNKGFIQYKFKVDNEWKCNENYPTIVDNGNKNNFIDTTNWEISAEEETTNSTTELSYRDNSKSYNKSFLTNATLTNSQNEYGNHFPKIEEMNENCSKSPEQYKNKINFDENIKKINVINFNNYIDNNMFGENDSYKIIKPINHELLNHMTYKNSNDTKEKNDDDDDDINNINTNTTVCSIVARHRLKFTTFVYYKSS